MVVVAEIRDPGSFAQAAPLRLQGLVDAWQPVPNLARALLLPAGGGEYRPCTLGMLRPKAGQREQQFAHAGRERGPHRLSPFPEW